MKSWKKLWKDELDKITPNLREDVKNAPIFTAENVNNGGNTAAKAIDRRNSLPIIAALAALLICAAVLCVCLIKPADTPNAFLFTVEINPTITLSTDRNGVVTGVIASNTDADIILSDESVRSRIVGQTLENAIAYYADCASKLGFIDLEKTGSAVRVSGLGNDTLLANAKTALEAYFTERGVYAVVIADSVGKEDFAARSGIPSDLSLEDTVKFIRESTALFTDRSAEGLNSEQIQDLYDDLIIANKLFDTIDKCLSDNIERLMKNAQDIQNLSKLYYDILRHPDNPLPIGDYWAVKRFGNSFSEEFAALMTEMQTALHRYKTDYGIDVSGIAQLKDAVESYLKISSLSALLENFSLEKFKEFSADITEILAMSGLISDEFIGYLNVPKNLEEYLQRTSDMIRTECNARLDAYAEIYQKFRQPIAKTDYDAYIQETIEQYGSLDLYWDSLRK